MIRWASIALAVLLGLILLVALIGLTRPRHHTARTQATYTQPPAEVWQTLADYEHWSEWNPEIKSVERLPDRNGHELIKVESSWGTAPTELTIWEPPRKLRTEMDAGSFSGSWTYELSPTPAGGTVLTITEAGEVGNPFFRAAMIFHDNKETMMAFHRALAQRLGARAEP